MCAETYPVPHYFIVRDTAERIGQARPAQPAEVKDAC